MPKSSAAADVHCRHSGVVRSLCRERRACARDRARASSVAICARRRSVAPPREPARAAFRPGRTLRHRACAIRASRTMCAKSSRASSTASEFDEFKQLYGSDAGDRFRPPLRLPGRHRRQQRHPVLRVRAQRHAFHRAVLPASTSRCCSCRTSRASWWAGKHESGRHRASDGAKMVTAVAAAQVPKLTRHHRRQLSAPAITDVRPGLRTAASCWMWPNARIVRHGRRTGGGRARTIRRDQLEAEGTTWSAAEEAQFTAPIRAPVRAPGPPLLRQRAAVG